MAETVYRGPAMSIGPLMGTVVPQAASGFLGGASGTQPGAVEPTDGPGIEYQANTFPDPRFGPFNKDSLKAGRIPVWLNSPYVVMVDAVGQATNSTSIAAAQNVTNGTAMTLVTVAAGGTAQNVTSNAITTLNPLVGSTNQGFPGSAAAVTVLGLDLGFMTGNINGTATVSNLSDSGVFYVGQWISIGGAGNSSKTASLFTQVQTIASATSITVSPAPLSTLTAAPISSANFYASAAGSFPFTGTFSGGATSNFTGPTGVQAYSVGGVGAVFNPLEGLARNLQITGVASGTGGNFAVVGYDVYGQLMHETITGPVGATTTSGVKCWKYILSITPQFTDAHNYSVGLGNLAGINLRSDKWEYMNIFYNAGFATTATGWTAANIGTPTATSTDVRGTVNVATLATIGGAFDGTKRLAIMMSVPLYNLLNSNPNNPVSLVGQAQF